MIQKMISFFIVLLLAFTGIILPKTGGKYAEFSTNSAAMEDTSFFEQSFCLPDHTTEILYNYGVSTFHLPTLARIEFNHSGSGSAPTTSVLLNRLLMKHRLVCQSSPKHTYSLQLLPGEAHPGAAKAYFVYTLCRLII